MSFRIAWPCWAVILCLPVFFVVSTGAFAADDGLKVLCPDGDAHELLEIGRGFLRNRESFSYFKCEFRVTEGWADSVETALAGKLSDAVRSTAVWVVDGPKEFFQLKPPDELLHRHRVPSLVKPAGPGGKAMVAFRIPTDSGAYLTDGQNSLRFSPFLRSVNISTNKLQLTRKSTTPFNLHMFGEHEEESPGRVLIKGGREWMRYAWIEPPAGTEKTKLVTVAFSNKRKGSGNVSSRAKFDPSRGFLPVEYSGYETEIGRPMAVGEPLFSMVWTDFRQCSGGRWWPMRGVLVRFNQASKEKPEKYRATLIEVTNLNVDAPPLETDFNLTLDARTGIVNPADMRSGFRLKTSRVIGLKDLATVLAECDAELKRVKAE